MADQESEKLCAKLTGVVADVPADEFYNQFNLDGHSFSEYYFKDMMRIFHLPGMEQWPSTLNTGDRHHGYTCSSHMGGGSFQGVVFSSWVAELAIATSSAIH